MQKISKKLVAVALAAIMIFSAIPLSGLANIDLSFGQKAAATSETLTSGIFNYVVDENGNAQITGNNITESSDITIPSEIDGYPVTSIGSYAFYNSTYITGVTIQKGIISIGPYAFYYCSNLKKVLIPESVKTIDSHAFYCCSSLTEITIPDGVETIGNYAFYYCSSLSSIKISKTVESIGSRAFSYCNALTEITVDGDNEYYQSIDGVLFNKEGTELIQYPVSKTAAAYAVPDDVETIGDYAFYYCKNLTIITLPKSLETIENYAFEFCSNLTNIDLPEGVTFIGYSSFEECDSLTSIVIPSTVTYLGGYAFGSCSSLADITIKEGARGIKYNAFNGSAHYDNSDNWYDSVYYVDDCLLYFNSYSVTSLVIREGTRVIADAVFQYKGKLTSVSIPDSVEYIGSNAFYNCDSLTSVDIPAGANVGEYAFAYCDLLETVNIGDNVVLDSYVFSGSNKISNLTAGSNVKGITKDAIDHTDFYKDKDNWDDGVVLYVGDNLICADYSISGAYTVKDGTTTIGDNAFAGCIGLTGISIPETVTYIGSSAFAACATLSEVQLPSTLTEINEGLFALCILLEEISLPAGITEIKDGAFAGCVSLKALPVTANINKIGPAAFAVCTSLTSVNIAANIEEIGIGAFAGCTSVEKFSVDTANANYTNDAAGALYDKAMTNLMAYPSASVATSYSIPEGVKTMELPFVSTLNLESLDIPASFASEDSEAILPLYISTITMKLDVNALIAEFAKYVDSLYDLYLMIQGLDSEEDAMALIADLIDTVLDYINGIESKDDLIGRIADFCLNLFDVAKADSFKSFTVANGNPYLFVKDGVLYAQAIDGADFETALVSCPTGKTGIVDIKNGTDIILPGAFAFCDLEEIRIPDSIESIYPLTFALSSTDSITIPASVKNFEKVAFSLAQISTLEFEDRKTLFENSNDADNGSFAALFADKIILPKSLKKIDDVTFALCFAKEIVLPKRLETIGDAAFGGAIFLEEINIPDSVTTINEMAFIAAISLKNVNISENSKLQTIGELAFAGTNVDEFYLPADVSNIGMLAFNPSAAAAVDTFMTVFRPDINEIIEMLEKEGVEINEEKLDSAIANVVSWFTKNAGVSVDPRNTCFSSENGVLYSYDKTVLHKVPETASGAFEIPNSVLSIAKTAFAFTDVTDVVIPNNVTSLEANAFTYASKLKTVTLGTGIKGIDSNTFSGCSALERIVIPPNVVSINSNAFSYCSDELTIVGYTDSYAYTFATENEITFESIDGKSYISLSAPTEVASATLPVYGFTHANTNIEIYDNGVKIADYVSGKSGYWRTEITLDSPENNSVHELTAKVFAGTDNEAVSEPVKVLYTTTTPVFESLTVYHNGYERTITAETIGQIPQYISFASYSPFTYVIKLSVYDGTKTLYVVSNGHKMPAVYDAKTDCYVAHGFFDSEDKSYIPEKVTLELGGCTLANTAFRFSFIIDPSGFVYEAVHSNRVEGATTSIYYKDEVGNAVLWAEAFLYDQVEKMTTGADGVFGWVVPNGEWQVKVEKEGYETAFSDWLIVPPEHTDVYIGLISKFAPTVNFVNGYTNSVEVSFSQYMQIDSVNTDNIVITDESGDVVTGYWSAVNSEVSGSDTSVNYASTFNFYPNYYLSGDCEYTITIKDVVNYAGKTIESAYTDTFTVKSKVTTLNAPQSLNLEYGKEYGDNSSENQICLDGTIAAANMKVNVSVTKNSSVELAETITLDDEGKAVITINPAIPGEVVVSFNLDGTSLVEKTRLSVVMPTEIPVTGITISDESAVMQLAAEKQLYATIAPDFANNKEVTWTSSDSNVVSVDETGRITALAAGSATITVTTKDGNFTDSCNVTVEAPEFTVTWIIDGESQTQGYNVGSKIVAPAVEDKDGYKFKGWDKEIPTEMPAENLEFVAVWDAVTYSVTWIVDGKETIVDYKFGNAISAPANPVKEGYTFKGWNGSIPSTMPSENLEFVAEWEINTYTVTWIVDGVETTEEYEFGEAITAPDAPSKTGLTFTNWTPSVPSTMPAKNMTFTAVYKPNYTAEIRDPSRDTISYGDTIVLHADITGTLPTNATIKWEANNGNFEILEISEDGYECKITPSSKGDTTFKISVVDANGNVISSDEQVMTSKAGFFDKIIAFFKKLFGLTENFPDVFKGLF